MATIFTPPLYVPRPPEETPWLGKAIAVSAVLLAAITIVLPNYPLKPTNQVAPQADEILWVGKSKPSPNVLLQLPAIPIVGARQTRQFNFVPDPVWVNESLPEPILSLGSLPPFTAKPTRKFDHVPEPFWQGTPEPIPAVQTQLPALPIFGARSTVKFDHVPEPFWQGRPSPIPAVHSQLPAIPVFGAKSTEQFNYVPEPDWRSDAGPVSYPLKAPPYSGPFFVSAGAVSSSTSVSYPASVLAGDVAIIVVAATADGTTITLPAVFTAEAQLNGGSTNHFRMGWQHCAGTEGGTSVTIGIGASSQSAGQIYIFRNVVLGGKPYESYSTTEQSSTGALTIDSPAVTSTGPNELATLIGVVSETKTFTPAAGYTEKVDNNSSGYSFTVDTAPLLAPATIAAGTIGINSALSADAVVFGFALKLQPPFVQQTLHFDHVPEPGWLGSPAPSPLALVLPPAFAPLPFRNAPWQGPIPDPDWIGAPEPVPAVQSQLPALPIFGARSTRQFNHVPEPDWLGKPTPLTVLYFPPPTVLPFHNYPWQGPIPDPDWIGKPKPIPAVQLQLPAIPPFTVKGTLQFNYVPDPFWTGQEVAVALSITLPPAAVVSLPFLNIRHFDFVPEPQPTQTRQPIPQVLQRLPAIPIFTSKGTRIFNVPDDLPWSMHGKGSASLYLPVSVVTPLETLKNIVMRVRVAGNTTSRVRSLSNILGPPMRVRTVSNVTARRKP